jgi:hypothetical protein
MSRFQRSTGEAQVGSSWHPTEEGWCWEVCAETHPENSAVGQYLEQLADEGFAQVDARWALVPWSSLYSLLRDESHLSSLRLLNLPPVAYWVPRLESRGTPRDQGYQINVAAWIGPEGSVSRQPPQRIGACLRQGEQTGLLPERAWRLVAEIQTFASAGPALTADERLRAAGRIRALALECGAGLDDYLRRTEIIVADQLELEISKSTVLGAPVIEITPKPAGAPPEWIKSFDKFNHVQERYDVSMPSGGLAHVVPSPAVKETLESIKRMPGRRVASDAARAFIHNPYAVLGEGAAEALSPESFERAREAAGIRFKSLQAIGSDPTGFRLRLLDAGGREPDAELHLMPVAATQLLAKSERSRNRGQPLISWEGEEIELTQESHRALDALSRWLAARVISAASIKFAEVFDLSAYSDRVVGFDGKVVAVPFVARIDADKGWIPENIDTGVVIAGAHGEPSRRVSFSPDQIEELASSVAKARAANQPTVVLPGTDVLVPTPEAERWVESFSVHQAAANNRVRQPKLTKDPKPPAERPVLRILHNIESLDYGKEPAVLRVPAGAEPELPKALRSEVELLPHQRVGVAWLQHRYGQLEQGVTGCLLADDMGLGKTLQALCLMTWCVEQQDCPKPCLVVAPVSLLENWKTEVDKFIVKRNGSVLALYGAELQSARLPAAEVDPELTAIGLKKFLRPGFEAGRAIVLTTYETLRDYEFSLARVPWGVVVCDEAQKIKNPAALVTRAAKALRADFKVACTGTPVENSLSDLWCLFDFFQAGLLGSLNEFTRTFRRAIETRALGHEPLIEYLRNAIDPWVLRRMKTDVANLPPKHERTHPEAAPEHMALPMSGVQRRLYAEAIGDFRRAMKSEDGRGAMLGILHRLRMICSHPTLLAHDDAESLSMGQQLADSPKLAWAMRHLESIRKRGEKVIVFSEFREVQRLLQRAIATRFDLHAPIVNGDTSVDPAREASRQRIIDVFQATPGFNVIILSTTAVGFGVNIQAANHVIHFTRPWNPAKEDQATDRAYRIGQTRPVYVYCPTVVGSGFESFDQRVDQLLAAKRALSRDMLAGVQELTVKDFEGL